MAFQFAFLPAKAGTGDLPGGQRDVGMHVADVAGAAGQVDGDVGDHALIDPLLLDKAAKQFDLLSR